MRAHRVFSGPTNLHMNSPTIGIANSTTIGIANSLVLVSIPSDPTISHVLDILRRQTG
jgi:hypothetical protein